MTIPCSLKRIISRSQKEKKRILDDVAEVCFIGCKLLVPLSQTPPQYQYVLVHLDHRIKTAHDIVKNILRI